MTLPPKLLSKYLARFDELIQKGKAIYDAIKVIPGEYYQPRISGHFLEPPIKAPDYYSVDYQAFYKWQINYKSLLAQIITLDSVQRKLIEKPGPFWGDKDNLANHLSVLEALKEDFEKGFL